MRTTVSFLLLVLSAVAVTAAPVDTRQYGLIHDGMSEAEVVRRLGPPDRREVSRRTTVARKSRYGSVAEERVEITLLYLGDTQIQHTAIRLEDGVVIGKVKFR